MKNRWIIYFMVMVLSFTTFVGCSQAKEKENEASVESEEPQSDIVEVDGIKYRPNRNLQTILFMGIDKEAKSDFCEVPGLNGQSDSLNVFVGDKETGKAQIIQISRDTMVDIDIYSLSGDKLMSEPGQITLQYAYGDGKNESCRLTTKKVSELLYGVDIPYYVSLTMEGMIEAANAVGGIDVKISGDYTSIHPSFVKGETVNMTGELVELYVRTRDVDVLESNVERMQRQSDFIQALVVKMKTMNADGEYLSLYQKMEPYMTTNMTAEEMKALTAYDISTDTINIPGEIVFKDGHAQFLPDNKELQRIVLNVFYIN